MDAIEAEHTRLGRPLGSYVNYSPEQVCEVVSNHFASGQPVHPTSPPVPSHPVLALPAPETDDATAAATEPGYFFTVSLDPEDSIWKMYAFSVADGGFVTSIPLPDPGTYYSVMFDANEGFVLQVPGQNPVPCTDLLVDPPVAAAPVVPPVKSMTTMPPGVAPSPTMLPGMEVHQPGPAGGITLTKQYPFFLIKSYSK